MPIELTRHLIESFQPDGDVLELACGTGQSTQFLAPIARSLTALDASPKMIEHNRRRLRDPKIRYVNSDVFSWKPDRRYDLVFFSFWLSHVPPRSFDSFWGFLRTCLKPAGRVAFIDEDDRGSGNDHLTTIKGIPAAIRTLRGGREIPIVKLYWPPADLEQRIRDLRWDATVKPVGDTFLYGVATPS
jgi:SAM-dependent methyltransferase